MTSVTAPPPPSHYEFPYYQYRETWNQNIIDGPKGDLETFTPPDGTTYNFLGVAELKTRFGIPAGPLLDSKYIQKYGSHGWSILTYKTIRSGEKDANGAVNIVFVDVHYPFDPHNIPQRVRAIEPPKELSHQFSITNSFGMPSQDPTILADDIPLANSFIQEGQVMVVSVFGCAHKGRSLEEDFVLVAKAAKEWGAKAVEVNYSCPNVDPTTGLLYENPDTVASISKAVVDALGDTPLIIKVGRYADKDTLEAVLIAADTAGVKAVNGINTVPVKVHNPDGTPTLGERRETAGICGIADLEVALQFVRDAREIIDRNGLNLTLIGGGGVTEASHFDLFIKAGADFVTSGAGAMRNPNLVKDWYESKASTVAFPESLLGKV